MPFPDVSKALSYLLAPLVGGITHAGTETPANLQQVLDFIRVGRVTGPDDGVTDFPVVDVDYFAATRDLAVAGADRVRDFLTLDSPYHVVQYPGGRAVLDRVATAVGPRQLPWLATGVVRITGTYRVETRRS